MLNKYKSLVEIELKQVDKLINELISKKTELIFNLGWHLISSGGKRLRPGLTILSAKLCGYEDGDRHITLASAIEFIHTATLLHDDVVDESALRRGQSTANDIWGNKASILVGDFLLSQSFCLMVSDGSLKVLDILSNAASIISEGEVKQLAALGNFEESKKYYFDIITAKTAKLFEAASEIGAVISDKDQLIQQSLKDFGLNFGIAFQIMDDTLDYSSHQESLGKNVGDDFYEAKITLPLIHAYDNSSTEEKSFWNEILTKESRDKQDLEQALEIMHKYNSIEFAINEANKYANLALNSLNIFPNSEYKTAIIELLDFCVKRDY